MAGANDDDPGFWPGYVAATAGLVLGLLIVTMALGISIFALGQLADLEPVAPPSAEEKPPEKPADRVASSEGGPPGLSQLQGVSFGLPNVFVELPDTSSDVAFSLDFVTPPESNLDPSNLQMAISLPQPMPVETSSDVIASIEKDTEVVASEKQLSSPASLQPETALEPVQAEQENNAFASNNVEVLNDTSGLSPQLPPVALSPPSSSLLDKVVEELAFAQNELVKDPVVIPQELRVAAGTPISTYPTLPEPVDTNNPGPDLPTFDDEFDKEAGKPIRVSFLGEAISIPNSSAVEIAAAINRDEVSGAFGWRAIVPAKIDNPRDVRAGYLRLIALRSALMDAGVPADRIDLRLIPSTSISADGGAEAELLPMDEADIPLRSAEIGQ